MILYREGYAFDSTQPQEFHGILFPPFFFDTPAARDHWNVTDIQPAVIEEEIVASSPQEENVVYEAVELTPSLESIPVEEEPKQPVKKTSRKKKEA